VNWFTFPNKGRLSYDFSDYKVRNLPSYRLQSLLGVGYSGVFRELLVSTFLFSLPNAGFSQADYRGREIERPDGLGPVVSDVEDGIQLRDLHQVSHFIREFEQLQFSLRPIWVENTPPMQSLYLGKMEAS